MKCLRHCLSSIGKRTDLIGGGLIRSAGGWKAVKAMKKAKIFAKSDERILGDNDFVEEIPAKTREAFDRRYALQATGVDID